MKTPEKNFLFLATGGTIEFVAGQTKMVEIGEHKTTYQKPNFRETSIIPKHLDKNHSELNYDFEQVCIKDSKDVEDKELATIKKHIDTSDCPYVIITHGTDTIVENARKLEELQTGNQKTIIFLGAFQPLEEVQSDGIETIAKAIEQAPKIGAGVFIAGNSKIFNCNAVRKDFELLDFVGL